MSEEIRSEFAAHRRKEPVAVVVPCFNEHEGVAQLSCALSMLESVFTKHYELEFIIVDDGSTDGTLNALREEFDCRHNVRILTYEENRGVAAAIMAGIRESRCEIVCSMDSDCTYDPQRFGEMIPQLVESVDLVTASPYHPGGRVCGVPPWRVTLSRTASRIYAILLRQHLYCYTSCFRVYRRSAVANIQLAYPGFAGIPELLWRLSSQRRRVVEFPAVLNVRKTGTSKMRIPKAIHGHLSLMACIILNRVFGPRVDKSPEPPSAVRPADESASERWTRRPRSHSSTNASCFAKKVKQ